MSATIDKKRKQDLGIYYTPETVVDFIYDVLNTLKQEDSQWWKSRYPSVIDPAAGEGVFLKGAIESGFTKPQYVFGIDTDENVTEQGGKMDLEHRFFHQNGLLSLDGKGDDLFDVVVGNPPYGGVGLEETEFTDELISQLTRFEVLPNSIKSPLKTASIQSTLFQTEKSFPIKQGVKNRIKSFPIEVLFIDRFIQLAKPGGWIAIIVPEGILSNSTLHYVREFIAKKTKVLAIVSLPRDTFKKVGTNAKTSILFLQNESKNLNYPVFLASINSLEKEYFDKISNSYKDFYYHRS